MANLNSLIIKEAIKTIKKAVKDNPYTEADKLKVIKKDKDRAVSFDIIGYPSDIETKMHIYLANTGTCGIGCWVTTNSPWWGKSESDLSKEYDFDFETLTLAVREIYG